MFTQSRPKDLIVIGLSVLGTMLLLAAEAAAAPPGRPLKTSFDSRSGAIGAADANQQSSMPTTAGPVSAACCVADQCSDGLTQSECDGLGGVFLAPPQKYPAVADCSENPCSTGSCCYGPGQCWDVHLGAPFTRFDCEAGQGTFIGGVRCQGGACASTPLHSCASHADCPNGDCVGDPQALNQPLPCPLCEIEGANNCQAYEEVAEYTLSDRSIGWSGVLAADDFTPQGSAVLSQVCVWGFYRDVDPDAPLLDCGPDVVSDQFRVRVYDNDPATGRVPRNLIGESLATSQRGGLPTPILWTSQVYGYQLTLAAPINLAAGSVYWLEVSNDVSEALESCKWFWMRKTPSSSSLSFLGTDYGYDATFEVPAEQAFCLNFEITPSTIGALDGPCCICDNSNCSLQTLYDCKAVNGLWDITETTCEGVTCSMVQPNDHCVDGPSFIASGVYLANNQCATTDGYGPIPSDTGGSQIESDLWYYYVAWGECQVVISECETGSRFDSMLAVYSHCGADPTGCDPTICPPCPIDAVTSQATLAGIGQDESCTGEEIGGAGFWTSHDQLGRDALPGECFLIRFGSAPGGGRGLATLGISCGICRGCEAVPISVIADTVNKPRFVSFTITSNDLCTANATPFPCCFGPGLGFCSMPGETAIRIVLSSLHVVDPPYSGGTTVSFNRFAGQAVYVGPPATYTENGAPGGIPFKASFTQCAPHYQDWNTVGLLHVTGPQIVPSSVYHVERLAAVCQGSEEVPSCLSGGFNVSDQTEIRTTRWGDVRTPYNPPDPSAQPDISDVSALVDKFRNAPGAPIKARGLLVGIPGNAWGVMDSALVGVAFGFGPIAACVDAFRGAPYPYRVGKCAGAPTPPRTGACAAHADCTGPNGAGPCNLYCP